MEESETSRRIGLGAMCFEDCGLSKVGWLSGALGADGNSFHSRHWAALEESAVAVGAETEASAQPAYFQMVLHPIQAANILNQIYIGAAKNSLYTGQKRKAANTVMMDVINLLSADSNLTDPWDEMLDGKWMYMLDRKSFLHNTCGGLSSSTLLGTTALTPRQKPTSATTAIGNNPYATLSPVWATCKHNASPSPDTSVSVSRVPTPPCKATTSSHNNGGSTLTTPPLEPYGPATRYFDIFSYGTKTDKL